MALKSVFTAALGLALMLAAPALADASLKPVKVMTVQAGEQSITRQFFGHVVARQTADLGFVVSGQLETFPVIEGDSLKQGDLVAQLDLETFELSLEQARLQREQAQRTLTRLQALSDRVSSKVNIEDATTSLALANVAVKNAEYALEHATLLAPFDALVAERSVANYTTVGVGTPVVRLHDMSEIRIEVDVPEVLFLHAEDSDRVSVTASFPTDPRRFPIVVREFNAETTSVAQSYRVTFAMPPQEGLRILPGASVTVTAEIGGPDLGMVLPATAVFVDPSGQTAVMAFDVTGGSTGSVRKVPVQVEPAPGGGISVLSGLESGTEIVEVGGASLQDGQSVRRFSGFGN